MTLAKAAPSPSVTPLPGSTTCLPGVHAAALLDGELREGGAGARVPESPSRVPPGGPAT